MTDAQHYWNLRRIFSGSGGTLGILYDPRHKTFAWSFEDFVRAEGVKFDGDTAIPAGDYVLRWRTVGRWAKRFQEKLGVPGSIEICDVENFTDVLIHIGNTKRDSEGCILLGTTADYDMLGVGSSTLAVQRFYKAVADLPGQHWLHIVDDFGRY